MRPLTHYIAKPMLPVGMKPFLQFAIEELDGLAEEGEAELEVVIGSEHLGWQIREWFGSRWGNLRIIHVSTPAPEGTGKRLGVVHQQLRFTEPTIVWLGDTFFSADAFRRMIMVDAEAEAVLGVTDHGPRHEEHGHCWISAERMTDSPEGKVIRCWKGRSSWASAGIFRLSPALMDRIAEGDVLTGEHRILPAVQEALDEGTDVRAVDIGAWIHLGDEPTPEENYLNVQGALLQ